MWPQDFGIATFVHPRVPVISAPSRVHAFEIVADPEVSDHRPLLLEI